MTAEGVLRLERLDDEALAAWTWPGRADDVARDVASGRTAAAAEALAEWYAEGLRRSHTEAPDAQRVYAVRRGEEHVGTVRLGLDPQGQTPGSGAVLTHLWIDPEHRRRGIGTRATQLAAADAFDHGVLAVMAIAPLDNEAALGSLRDAGLRPWGWVLEADPRVLSPRAKAKGVLDETSSRESPSGAVIDLSGRFGRAVAVAPGTVPGDRVAQVHLGSFRPTRRGSRRLAESLLQWAGSRGFAALQLMLEDKHRDAVLRSKAAWTVTHVMTKLQPSPEGHDLTMVQPDGGLRSWECTCGEVIPGPLLHAETAIAFQRHLCHVWCEQVLGPGPGQESLPHSP